MMVLKGSDEGAVRSFSCAEFGLLWVRLFYPFS